MFTLFISLLAASICVIHAASNNAGYLTHNGKSEAWSNITLRASSARWTQFQYIVADNNLDYFSVSDLNEMRQNDAAADDWNVVALVDRCYGCDGGSDMETVEEIYDCDTDEAVNGKFNGSKILQKDGQRWCEIYSFEHELDLMNPDNIEEFVSMMNVFAATSTYFMLTFWDHGGAWSGFGDDEHNGGSNDTVNNLDGLFSAVSNGLDNAAFGRLDILGFDACIMADYSVLHYLDTYGVTQYYIASEVSEPGDGWDYTAIDPSMQNATAFGKALIDGFVNQGNVQVEDAGAGYTLAMFDMDKVAGFLNQFDSFMTSATAAIEAYDYGMLMSILRGQAVTIAAEEDFHIYDMGLFLAGMTADTNIFWETCSDRITTAGNNAVQYLNESIVYYQADFVRQDMTGSTIFYSTDTDDIEGFNYYNDDMQSTQYMAFLSAMNKTLAKVESGDVEWTTDSCTATAPSTNFTFVIGNNEVAYSEDFGLYKLSTEVTATVMGADGTLFLSDSNGSMYMEVAELDTAILDEDFDTAQLVTYWDGKVAMFQNTISADSVLYEALNLSNDSSFATGQISFVSYDKATGMPLGYIGKYPVQVYDRIVDVGSLNDSANAGYLQFEVKFGADFEQDISIHDVKLYEIDVSEGVIAEVPFEESIRVITPMVMMEIDDVPSWGNNTTEEPMSTTEEAMSTTEESMESTFDFDWGNFSWPWDTDNSSSGQYVPMGILVWPNFSVTVRDVISEGNFKFGVDAYDVFGNEAYTEFDVSNHSSWSWNFSTTNMESTMETMETMETTETTGEDMSTTETIMKTTEMIDTTENDSNTSEKLEHGLDDVPGFVWLILLSALLVMVFVFGAMWYRSRKQVEELIATGQGVPVGKSPYVQMDDKGDGML